MLFSRRPQAWQTFLAVVSTCGLLLGADAALARRNEPEAPPLATVQRAALPAQAQATERLIRSGGPFPFPKDGITFGNRERLLPAERRGYYREYTVPTPGARDRGARRIVCGGRVAARPDACYFTADHYASFRRIAP